MAEGIGISLYVSDNATAGLTKVNQGLLRLKKQAADTDGKLSELAKRKIQLTVDTERAKKALQEARRAFDDTDESAKRLADAGAEYDRLQRELRGVAREARSAESDLSKLNDKLSQYDNRAESSSGGLSLSGSVDGGGLMSRIAGAGAVQAVGSLLSEAAGAYVGSAFGSDGASMFSSILSGGASGAAIGSMIAPGIGTAIGAGVGSLLGAASGAIGQFNSRDDYFKGIVHNQYENSWAEMQNSLTGGTATAANREVTDLAFATLLGDKDKAADWLDELQDFAAVTPFAFEDLTSMSRTLMSYGIKGSEEQRGWMTAIGDAGSAVGLSGADLTMLAAYLGRMNSTDKVSLEYLNPLMERGIDAIGYLADNLGTSKDAVYEMISKGQLSGIEASKLIIEKMGSENAGAMDAISQTYSGLTSTLEDNRAQLDAAMGKGYMETRSKGLQEEIDYLDGETGAKMEEMYGLIGQWQASVENAHDEALRTAMENATKSDEYRLALAAGDGAEMGRLLAEAKAQAEAEYTKSSEYETLVNTQTAMVEDARNTLSQSYYDLGYNLGQEMTKGLAAVMQKEYQDALNAQVDASMAYHQAIGSYGGTDAAAAWNGHAAGLSYVPYDGYRAVLHEGERVLTAAENRGASAVPQINISGNQFTVREEADIDKIAVELMQKILEARGLMG